MLYDTIQNDLKSALLEKRVSETEALRYLMSELKNLSIEFRRDPTDEEIITRVKKIVKQLSESADLFKANDRAALSAQYTAQIEIYKAYIPAEMEDIELEPMIVSFIEEQKKLDTFNEKQVIGQAVSKFKDVASPSRIVQIVTKFMS